MTNEEKAKLEGFIKEVKKKEDNSTDVDEKHTDFREYQNNKEI